MTERLYYTDSFLREFDARVVSCTPRGEEESEWIVRLDRTAFYPTSGGQPHDTGRLNEAAVRGVFEREDDKEILHVTDRPIPAGPVHGSIDWERRFDHMQQHTGQHLLSAAFLKLFGFPTVSFHLGGENSTIDLDAPNLAARHLREVADLVNRVVFEDRVIRVSFHDREELAGLGIRKQVARAGTLRVVEIDGFDIQPCGGTHAARTGQVGSVLIRKTERQKQQWRAEFVCGRRAVRDARADFETLGAAAREIGCGTPELPAMVTKLLDERKTAHRESALLAARLAELEAKALLARGERTIVHAFDRADAGFLRQVAAALAAVAGVRAVLASRSTHQFVFAQAAESAGDMKRLLAETLLAAGGKGGGSKDFAQGTVPASANIDEILARAGQLLHPAKG